MTFTAIPTEQTTAVTDLVIAVVAVACALSVRRPGRSLPFRLRTWTWIYGLLALAAVLGTIVHGLRLSDTLSGALWPPLYLALGLVVALFVVAAVHDWKGRGPAARLTPLMVSVGVGFFLVTQLWRGSFAVFVIYEAVAMLLALGIYTHLALRRRLAGAWIVVVAIVLNLVAAAVQASDLEITVVVPFDHNGLFHLVQMVAIVVLAVGLVRGFRAARG